MIDWTKPIQTRSGRPARVLCTDLKDTEYPVAVAVLVSDKHEAAYTYTAEGKYAIEGDEPFDIINVPEKRVRYFNVFDMSEGFNSRAKADRAAGVKVRRACIRVEYIDGQFDD